MATNNSNNNNEINLNTSIEPDIQYETVEVKVIYWTWRDKNNDVGRRIWLQYPPSAVNRLDILREHNN